MRKRRGWKWKRVAACFLTAAMLLTMPGMSAFADEADALVTNTGGCEHHLEHTEDCGYTEGEVGAPCEHEHTEECYTLVKKCIHEHDESCYPVSEKSGLEETATPSEAEEMEPTQCTHECTKESGCITEKLNCAHEQGEHDDTCGYIPAKEGTPCEYVCEVCQPQNGVVNLEQISLLANTEDTIRITTNCVYANGIPIVIKENGSITSIYDKDGTLLSGDVDVSKKWIFGGWSDGENHSGNTSVTMESGTVTKNIYGGSSGGTLEGSTKVIIKGGKVGWVYGGGEYDTVNGTARVTIHSDSKIWGNSAGSDSADAFNRGTIFGGGYEGTVNETEVTLLGGDFGWAYGGGNGSTVTSTNIQLLDNPDNWCNVYGGGNGGSVETANLTVREVANPGYAVFMYGGGWCDDVETANITIGGDCRLAGNIGIYATGSGESGSSNTSTVEEANFVIDNFDLISVGNTTVCGPLVGTNVDGTSTVLVTGSKTPTASMQLFLKDIDEVTLKQSSAVLFGADPSDPGNPYQPLEIGHLEVESSGEAIFAFGNTSVTIKELAGSGKLLFEGQAKQPTPITGVESVLSTVTAPLQITGRGVALTIDGTAFISGPGITSAKGFISGMNGYTAVNVDDGIQLKKSTEVKTPVQITLATFDKESYAYGETMNLSIEAKIAGGAPLTGETVYIWAGNAGTQVGSVVLDDQGKGTFSLKVNSFLRDIFSDPAKQTLLAYYQGSDQYDHYVSMMTLAGTNKQNFTFTNADIALTQEITAPALNQNPVRKLEVGDTFFTAEVLWSPDHTAFQADTPYSASILLKPKQSYDFKSIGTITYQGTPVTSQVQSDGSLLLPNVKMFAEIPVGNLVYDTEQKPLDTVPAELQKKFSSIEELKEALYQGVIQQMAEISKENIAHYDVKLLVSLDSGATWEAATPGNFPDGGIQVTIPYPAGTNGKTHDFVVAHMLTRAMNGKNPGEIEFPAVEENASGITFRVYGLSPISVGWKQVADASDDDNQDKDNSGNTSGDSSDSNGSTSGSNGSSGNSSGSNGSHRDSSDRNDRAEDNRFGNVTRDPKKGYMNSKLGVITGAANSTAQDGYSHWMQDAHGWWLRYADHSYPKGVRYSDSRVAYTWEQVNGNWWAFDENGYIKTGWLFDDTYGGWFYVDADRGMQTGWIQVQGVWYYLNQVSDGTKGRMYAGQKTPDGYFVGENGAWDRKEK